MASKIYHISLKVEFEPPKRKTCASTQEREMARPLANRIKRGTTCIKKYIHKCQKKYKCIGPGLSPEA